MVAAGRKNLRRWKKSWKNDEEWMRKAGFTAVNLWKEVEGWKEMPKDVEDEPGRDGVYGDDRAWQRDEVCSDAWECQGDREQERRDPYLGEMI